MPRNQVIAPRFGRYEILRELGRGGMGVVYVARDPQLGRSVALKIVTPSDARPVAGERTRLRLLNEARALARLDHPNVVTIYDVGRHDRSVWIAMELVDGVTLRSWARESQDWRARLAALIAAGRGLAAAHRSGLLHRDIKPDNVLVGRDRGVRVADFGLASGPWDETSELSVEGIVVRMPRSVALTRPGAVMGTPQYMAPEQRTGARLDARSDQYSFCVMAHEVLLGVRPGEDGARANEASAVPRRVLRALHRGLRMDPRRRFASMDALLAALERGAGRRRATLLTVAGLALGVGLGVQSDGGRGVEPMHERAMPEALAHLVPYEQRLTLVAERIDAGDFAAALAEARRVNARAADSGSTRIEAEAKVAVGRAALLSRDTNLAAESLEAGYLLADAAELHTLSADAAIDLAQVHGAVGIDPDQARTWLRRAEAAMGDDPDQRTRWLEAAGAVDLRAGDVDRARTHYEEAQRHNGGEPSIATLTGLATVYGLLDDQPLAARTWRRAEAIQRSRGAADHPRLATLATNLGISLIRLERHADALAAFSRAKELAQRVPSASRTLPHALNGVAAALNGMGRHEAAAAAADQAAALMRARVGEHPWVANCLSNAGEARWRLGDLDGAERDFSTAHVLWQTTLGSDAAALAFAEVGLGRIAVARGDAATGVKRLERALELTGAAAGDRVRLAELRLELARALRANGQPDAAGRQARLALALAENDGRRGRLRTEVERWLASEA